MIEHVIFDLDGTLTDPAMGITNSVMYALHKMGEPVAQREAYYPWIGPSLIGSFMEFAGMSEERATEAVRCYREYFSVKGLFENEPYAGIEEVLLSLQKAGKGVYLATSKPEEFAVPILEHFGLSKYFTCICGNTIANLRPEKEDVIRYLLSLYPCISPENAVMVGDRKFDCLGAEKFGIKTIGVLYGYGTKDELTEAGAISLAADTAALKKLLLE